LLVLLACAGIGALLVANFNTRQRAALDETVGNRATFAASVLEQQMLGLVRTLGLLAPIAEAANDHARAALAGTGIMLVERNSALAEMMPAKIAAPAFATLDRAARTAAAEAMATRTPRFSPFDRGQNDKDRGIDLWLPFVASGNEPAVLQAHIPLSFLGDALKSLDSDGPWSIVVAGRDGRVLAKLGAARAWSGMSVIDALRDKADDAPDAPGFAGALSSTPSEFGWRVGAATSLTSLQDRARRNWARFLAVTCLLTVFTFAFGDSLLQTSEEASASPSEKRSPEAFDGAMPMRAAKMNYLEPGPEDRYSVEHRLRMAIEAGGISVWQWNRSSGSLLWDVNCAADLLKLQPDMPEPTARDLLRRTNKHDRRRLLQALRSAIAGDKPFAADLRLKRFDGAQRSYAARGTPLKEDGRIVGFVGVFYDITEQSLALSRTDALLREVSHRSKNMLALILAMARLTAREAVDVKSHLKDFALRVAGLAASQDLIVAADWRNVDFATLASAETEAVARADAKRVKIAGPPLLLMPEAAQTLGMILTELTLNAAEHGALSVATGTVRLSWEFPDDATVTIHWREMGGPPYDPELRKGYGMAVVERFSTQGLKLSSFVTSDPDGFTWTLTGPLAHIGAPPPQSAA
jgi:two-component sensor histidine kinase